MESFFLDKWKSFLRYIDLPGEKTPLVYLHGVGCASSMDFPEVVTKPALAGYRSLLVDFLGFGFSDRPPGFGYTIEDHAQTVEELLDHLKVKDCVVIGHSMGGAVAITLATNRPDLVSRLIIAEGNLDPGGGLVTKTVAGQSESEFETAGYNMLLEKIRSMGFSTSLGSFQISAPHALYRSSVSLVKGTRPTMRENLLRLEIPRAYIFGERSLPDPDAERLPAYGVQVLIVPNAGHGMMNENPGGVAETIGYILQQSPELVPATLS
jgi:pimeloyl-ACP methyl ester carboxylesterase